MVGVSYEEDQGSCARCLSQCGQYVSSVKERISIFDRNEKAASSSKDVSLLQSACTLPFQFSVTHSFPNNFNKRPYDIRTQFVS